MKLKQKIIFNVCVVLLVTLCVINHLGHETVMTIQQIALNDVNQDDQQLAAETALFKITDLVCNPTEPYVITMVLAQYADGKLLGQQIIYQDDQLYGQLAYFNDSYLELQMIPNDVKGYGVKASFGPIVQGQQKPSIQEKQWVLQDDVQYEKTWSFVEQVVLEKDAGVSLVMMTDGVPASHFPEIAVFNEVVEQKGRVATVKLFVSQ